MSKHKKNRLKINPEQKSFYWKEPSWLGLVYYLDEVVQLVEGVEEGGGGSNLKEDVSEDPNRTPCSS